jgi:hypothetical protein
MKLATFDVSKQDSDLITKIVLRAISTLRVENDDRLMLAMDLTACHANGCPLKLQELLDAPKFDFAHDIHGIQRHIDRTTGELKDCFCPRTAD